MRVGPAFRSGLRSSLTLRHIFTLVSLGLSSSFPEGFLKGTNDEHKDPTNVKMNKNSTTDAFLWLSRQCELNQPEGMHVVQFRVLASVAWSERNAPPNATLVLRLPWTLRHSFGDRGALQRVEKSERGAWVRAVNDSRMKSLKTKDSISSTVVHPARTLPPYRC